VTLAVHERQEREEKKTGWCDGGVVDAVVENMVTTMYDVYDVYTPVDVITE